MNSNYLKCDCTRAEALRDGQLFDLSRIRPAAGSYFTVPVAISRRLWQALFGDAPFALNHPRLAQLCRTVISTIATDRGDEERLGLFSNTLWLRLPTGSGDLKVKIVCHPGDSLEPVLTLMEAGETTAFEV